MRNNVAQSDCRVLLIGEAGEAYDLLAGAVLTDYGIEGWRPLPDGRNQLMFFPWTSIAYVQYERYQLPAAKATP